MTRRATKARSPRYRTLERALRHLRDCLLPRNFDPTGTYPPRVHARATAYRLLAHAEFESYLEDRVEEVCLANVRAWQASGTPSRTIASLLAFCGQLMERPPDTKAPPQASKAAAWQKRLQLSEKITTATNALVHAVRHNHGIREENILRLLLPVGVDPDLLDDIWLAAANSFAQARGATAHSSATRTQTPPDPQTELATVQTLLSGFRDIDTRLNELLP